MNALVFGGNGFIGSYLLDELISAGHSVRVFDRFNERFRPPHPDVDYFTGQFGDAVSMAEALQGIDIVYHLVSTTVPGTSNMNPLADINDNLVATVTLLEQMIKIGVKRIVYISSGGTVYGKPETLPIPESHHRNPICSYGVVKVAIENYLMMYQELHGLCPTIIRPSNPFGPRQGHTGVQGVIATFVAKLHHREPLKVWGDGSVIRDYLYVGDLARLCLLAGEGNYSGVLNSGSGKGISISSIIQHLEKVTGITPSVVYQPGRSFDVKEVVLNVEKAKAALGWEPSVEFTEGLRRHWDWYCGMHQR